MEYEADQLGLEYLEKAGVPLEGAKLFFDGAPQERPLFPGLNPRLLTMLSTHPSEASRSVSIAEQLKQVEVVENKLPKTPVPWKELRRACRWTPLKVDFEIDKIRCIENCDGIDFSPKS